MSPEPHNHKLLIACVLLLGLVAILFYRENTKINLRIKIQDSRDQKMVSVLETTPVIAKAVSVFSVNRHKKIFGKNDEVALPIASITKVMTTVVALDAYGLDDVVTISPIAIKQAGDFTLTVGEKWKIRDLAKLTLISSANDGAYALGENYQDGPVNFLFEMNARAKRLGMEHTTFNNIMGLDIDGKATAFASALDVNLMSTYAMLAYPGIFSVTTLPEINLASEMGVAHNFKNTDTITEKIPDLVFSKTGYTEIAQGNLVIIFKNKDGEELAVTILGSTYEGRFEDMEKIVNSLYSI